VSTPVDVKALAEVVDAAGFSAPNSNVRSLIAALRIATEALRTIAAKYDEPTDRRIMAENALAWIAEKVSL
jgi:hypothetical protein